MTCVILRDSAFQFTITSRTSQSGKWYLEVTIYQSWWSRYWLAWPRPAGLPREWCSSGQDVAFQGGPDWGKDGDKWSPNNWASHSLLCPAAISCSSQGTSKSRTSRNFGKQDVDGGETQIWNLFIFLPKWLKMTKQELHDNPKEQKKASNQS